MRVGSSNRRRGRASGGRSAPAGKVSRRTFSAFVIAGTHSGVGKTTITLGIMAALRRRGLKVQPFKVGPDFIDPGLHAVVTGVPSYNLDGWMLPWKYNRRCFEKNVRGKDAAVVEGMMGLYDGHSGTSEIGSTAEMAKRLGLPVILVVDASALARSAAALVLGYRLFDRRVKLAGVIFNRVGGKGHVEFLRDALKSFPALACFGGLPFDDRMQIPERHLGLMTAEENFFDRRRAARLARWVETHLDLDALLGCARAARPPAQESSNGKSAAQEVSIAVARDPAFCFYYPDNLAALEAAGARLKFFSPVSDCALPLGTRGIYLGGGYPELYAKKLAQNRSMRAAIRRFIEAGGPVYAECGGFMYLLRGLIDGKNREYPMAGVFPFRSKMRPTLRMLGYREIFFEGKSFLPARASARGHEFRYSELKNSSARARGVDIAYAARAGTRSGRCAGYVYKNCVAGYAHLHFGSNPKLAEKFVAACKLRPA